MPGSAGRPDSVTLSRLYVDDKMTIAALAAQFGVAAQTVHNWLVAAGVPRRPSPAEPRRDVNDEDIVGLYCRQGMTAAEISARLGCSTSLVYSRLARLGVARRPRVSRRARPDGTELAHLYTERGLSLREIAELHGVSAQSVRRWLLDARIDRRRPGAAPAECTEDECVELYRAGWSAPDIAFRLGCSSASVYRYLDAAGVSRRRVGPRISRGELVAALDHGLSAPAIAAAFGVSVSCVCRALTRERVMTASQAARQRRALRYAALDDTDDGGTVSGGARR
jgi:transposase